MRSETLYERSKKILSQLSQLKTIGNYLRIVDAKLSRTSAPIPFSVACPVDQLGPLYVSATPIHLLTGKPDPVSVLWTLTRSGDPLCVLLNYLLPKDKNIEIKNWEEAMHKQNLNQCKAQVYFCIMSCRNVLHWAETELFSISELYQDDIAGFLKVLYTFEKIISLLIDKKIIIEEKDSNRKSITSSKSAQSTLSVDGNLSKVFSELLQTEKKYVKDLEKLLDYQIYVVTFNVLKPEVVEILFANLPALVDFQRRFSICTEILMDDTNEIDMRLRIGALFVQTETAFSVYDGFCKNYNKAIDITDSESAALAQANHLMECSYELPSFLIKPIQRICKFPLLINEVIKQSKLEPESLIYKELQLGLKSIKKAADRVNEVRRKQENLLVKEDLEKRVDEWKGHDPSSFGDLLLHDKFLMLVNDSERELLVYLFERIILCCKEVQNTSVLRAFKQKQSSSKSVFQIKGRIWIGNVSGVVNCTTKEEFMLKVFWRSQEMESFTLKCRNEEQLKLWQLTLERYLEKLKDKKRKKLSLGPMPRQSPKMELDDEDNHASNKQRPPRPPPPDVELKESPLPTGKSYFDSGEDRQEQEANRPTELNLSKRRSSLSYAAQMPSPIPSYKPAPPYDYPHIFSNDGLSKEEKKSGKAPPPRPSPPPQLKLDDVVQPLGHTSPDRPKSIATTPNNKRTTSVIEDEGSYVSPRKAPAPPSEKFRIRSTTDSQLTRTTSPKPQTQPIKVKIHTQNDKYALIITERTLPYTELYTRIQAKIHSPRFKVNFQDDDRQKLFIRGDEDVLIALQYAEKREDKTLNLFITVE